MAVIDTLANYWAYNEASGNAVDAHGAMTLTDVGSVGAITGVVSGGRSFSGSNQNFASATGITVPFGGGLTGPWTFAFWFRAVSTAQSNKYVFLSTNSGGGTQTAILYEFTNDTVEFYSDFTGSDPRTSSGLTVSDTNWHYLAYRKNASGTSAWDKFIDGAKTSINASIAFTLPATHDRSFVGASNSGNYCNCELDEMGWWTGALSDAQMTWLYNSGAGRSYGDIVAEAGGGSTVARLTGGLVNGGAILGGRLVA